MEHRELDDQDIMNKIRLQYKTNCQRLRNFREHMMIEDNLKEIHKNEISKDKFNDYLVEFQKNLESKGRQMKIERLKMKINDIQLTLENEMLKKKEIPKIKRKIIPLGIYKYIPNKNNNNKKDSKKTKSTNNNISSFSRYIKDKISEEI